MKTLGDVRGVLNLLKALSAFTAALILTLGTTSSFASEEESYNGSIDSGLRVIPVARENRARFDGTIGGGFEQLSVTSPSSALNINNGSVLKLQGEKPFGNSSFYFTSSFSYLRTTGNLNYDYSSPTAIYKANNVNYVADDFRLEAGIRLKFFNNYALRPYVEGGGTGGYLQLSYDSSLHTPAVVAAGTDYKTLDNVLEFGYYAEGGIEYQAGRNWGLRAAYHYVNLSTLKILTLGNQNVTYTGDTYYGGVFWNL